MVALTVVGVVMLGTLLLVLALLLYGASIDSIAAFVPVVLVLNGACAWLGLYAPALFIRATYDMRAHWQCVSSVGARVLSTVYLWPAASVLVPAGSVVDALVFAVPGVVCMVGIQLSLCPPTARGPRLLRQLSLRSEGYHAARSARIREIAVADRRVAELASVS